MKPKLFQLQHTGGDGGHWHKVSDHETYAAAGRGKLRGTLTKDPDDEYRITALVDTIFVKRHYCRGWMNSHPLPYPCSQSVLVRAEWKAGESEPVVVPEGWYADNQCGKCHKQEEGE